MESTFEQMGGTYHQAGDYMVPDRLLDDADKGDVGTYGRMRMRFLQEHHGDTYNSMLLAGRLWRHLKETDTACHEQLDLLIPAMAKKEGVTEALKASDRMAWVGRMNNIRNRAEEIVLHDFVYTL